MNTNFNSRKENLLNNETRYNSNFSQYIKNKFNKKDRCFKYNEKRYLSYLTNAFCKKKKQLIKKKLIIKLIEIKLKSFEKKNLIYN